jgi:hypothetical protein
VPEVEANAAKAEKAFLASVVVVSSDAAKLAKAYTDGAATTPAMLERVKISMPVHDQPQG